MDTAAITRHREMLIESDSTILISHDDKIAFHFPDNVSLVVRMKRMHLEKSQPVHSNDR